jgi:hypothetical protein
MESIMRIWLTLALVVTLAACGSGGIDGTYTDDSGMARYTFHRGGKVSITTMGVEAETNYEVEGQKVKFVGPQGALVMTILEDGSLQGPLGMILRKQGE